MATITTSFRNRSTSSSSSSSGSSSSSSSGSASAARRASDQYVGALQGQHDAVTERELQRYGDSKEDLDVANQYFQEDISRIKSRTNTDFFSGIALQNAEFSQTLDNIANSTKQRVGTFQGLGKRAIETATGVKTDNDARYKLNFDRNNEDINTNEDRTNARYKLNSDRLSRDKTQFQDDRATDRSVLGIQAKSGFQQYQDNVTTSRVLTENNAAQTYQPITGGGTGIQNLFNFFK